MTIPAFRPSVGEEELDSIREAFQRGWLGMGEMTARFESAIADLLGARHVIAVNSCTAALQLSLEVLDLEPGSEVIVPSMTFIATPQAVCNAGLTPVFCEIRPESLNLDIEDVASRITDRTRAVIPVHYAGEACDMDGLQAIVEGRRIAIIEDAAHAFGSTYHDQALGTIGDLGCLSFNAIKNVTCGEGGAILTDCERMAERLQCRRCLGIDRDGWLRQQSARPWEYRVSGPGHRMHMSDINAAIGLAQLPKADRFRTLKLEIARRYDEAFADIEAIRPLNRSDETFPFSYVVRILDGRRDELIETMREREVSLLVQFIPNHLQPVFADHQASLPHTECAYAEIVSLPFHVELTDRDLEYVIEGVRRFFKHSGTARLAVIETSRVQPHRPKESVAR